MIEDIGIFRSFRFVGRICRRCRHSTYSHVTALQFRLTVIVNEADSELCRRFGQPRSYIGSIVRYSCESRFPLEDISRTGRYVFANRHFVACQQVTLDLHTTVLLKHDGVFDLLSLVGSRVGYIAGHFAESRTPSGEVVGIIQILLTSRIGS